LNNYKKFGLRAFSRGDYDGAKMYFSLASGALGEEEVMFLVSLCESAKSHPKRAKALFQSYYRHKKRDFGALCKELSQIEFDQNNFIESEISALASAVPYHEFRALADAHESDFAQFFENFTLSAKIVIKDKRDFLDFLGLLKRHEMYDLALRYAETMAHEHPWDERLGQILGEIRTKADDENRA